MESHFLTKDEFNVLLKQWQGKNIHISKVEMDDFDDIMMRLDQLSYETNKMSIDGYEPLHTLQLIGNEGKILTNQGGYEELPSSTYEIPLQNASLYEFDGIEFLVSTDRAVYKIIKTDL